jgi:hypothetical protein
MSARRLSYVALMVAMGLTGAYAETIPNFELMTLIVFGSGSLLGVRDGIVVGAVTMLLFSTLNPYGAAHPLVTASQMAGTALAGAAGGWCALAGVVRLPIPARAAVLAAVGAVVTLLFDLITNLATGLLFGQIVATLIGGLLFSVWHIVTNAILFAVVGAPLLGALDPYRSRLSS